MTTLLVSRDDNGQVSSSFLESTPVVATATGDIRIDVSHSSLNFKDGLALSGNPGVMRSNPLVPGIDAVGTVREAPEGSGFHPGELVTVNGWGIGESRPGGFSESLSVPAEWVIPVPAGLTAEHAAAIGTAGFTAALSVLALERGGVTPARGEVLVTGASGGVGSIAVALLAVTGHRVVASSGRPENTHYVRHLGASAVIAREELAAAGKPLQSQRWAGAVDSVGGGTLATVLAQAQYGATIAACGLVGGNELPTTVLPFILRAVSLVGINSVECPRHQRIAAWDRLARDLDLELLDSITTTIGLREVPDAAAAILRGELRGRTVVRIG